MGNYNSPRQNEVGESNIKHTDYSDSNTSYLSMEHAAKFLFVSVSKMEKISASRLIPVYKPTKGKVYFKKQDLIDYIESGRQKSIYEVESEAICEIANNKRSLGKVIKK